MSEERSKRKLAAILSADVEGYSRLMEDDEEATVRTITSYRDLMVTQIQSQNGRVVDAKGDNVLAEFSSVVDAVRCAAEIQKELAKENSPLPEHRRMEFRIGVNLGDVIEEGGTIYGDGVNIAARLEGLAEGGGICISGSVYDQIENKLGLEFEYLGEHSVKNIKKAVRVYQVRVEDRISAVEIGLDLHLPDRPSIAVLPFANMSGDPEQEYFSDGITEEIITGLSKVPRLFVIARNSTFTYKGRPVRVQKVGQELGVRYVLEGSVRRAEGRVRITAQLVDAKSGTHLWAEKYDRDLKDIFALQDEITLKVITALQVRLTEGEQAFIVVKGTDDFDAYQRFLRGRENVLRYTKEGAITARKMAEEAISLDPGYPRGYRLLGTTHMMYVAFGLAENPEKSLLKAAELYDKVLSLDPSDVVARSLLGLSYTLMRQHEKGMVEAETAVALNPNAADAHDFLGYILHFNGRHEEGIEEIKKAIRLNPFPPNMYFLHLAYAYFGSGVYEESIAACKKALRLQPENLFSHLLLTAAYSLLGYGEKAHAEAAEVLRINPKFSLERYAKTLSYKNQADVDSQIDALRNAGLQ